MTPQPSEQPRTAVYWRLSGALAVLTEWAEGEEGEGCHWCLFSEGHEGGCPVGEARAILEAEAAAPDPVASPAPLDVELLADAIHLAISKRTLDGPPTQWAAALATEYGAPPPAPLDPAHLFRVPFDRDYVLLPDEADGWTDDQFDAFYEGLAAGIQVVKDRYESPELREREARKLAALEGQSVAEEPTDD